MAMEIVNGYPCRNCTDAEKAQKGIDPTAGPDARPGETKADVKAREAGGSNEERGINRPLDAGTIGTVLNILV
jgi:hypothetical protein